MFKKIKRIADLPELFATKEFNMLAEQAPSKRHLEYMQDMFVHYYNEIGTTIEQNPDNKMEIMVGLYEKIDEILKTELEKDKAAITCLKDPVGCSFCCYINVDILPVEGELLLEYAKQHNIPIDWTRVEKQAAAKEYRDLQYSDRKCVFLQPDGKCGVYEVRPTACRVYHVASPVEKCNSEFEKHDVSYFADLEVEAIISVMGNLLITEQERKYSRMGSMLMKLNATNND